MGLNLNVYISATNETITIDAENADSVNSVFLKISDMGYSIESQKLYFNDILLDESKTLSYYNVQKNDIFTLVPISNNSTENNWIIFAITLILLLLLLKVFNTK